MHRFHVGATIGFATPKATPAIGATTATPSTGLFGSLGGKTAAVTPAATLSTATTVYVLL